MATTRNPVILVHGILGQRHLYWNLFKKRLQEDGFRFHDCVLPYGMLGDMRIAARFLKDKVDAALRHDATQKVDLVCHSAGGLVARYYLMFLDGHRHVERLVTMGTPHQGTYFSYVFGAPLISMTAISRQAHPGSHFLAEINGPGALPAGVQVHNIWSPIDGVVLPSQNAHLPGSHAVKMPWVTHWGFLWRRDAYDVVRDCLLT